MRQILEIYILTKGKTDVKSMDTGTRSTLYMLLSSYIIERNPGPEVVTRFIQFIDSPDGPYMAEMKAVFASVFDRATYEAVGMSIGLGKE